MNVAPAALNGIHSATASKCFDYVMPDETMRFESSAALRHICDRNDSAERLRNAFALAIIVTQAWPDRTGWGWVGRWLGGGARYDK